MIIEIYFIEGNGGKGLVGLPYLTYSGNRYTPSDIFGDSCYPIREMIGEGISASCTEGIGWVGSIHSQGIDPTMGYWLTNDGPADSTIQIEVAQIIDPTTVYYYDEGNNLT